jgi:phosphate transport system substrate-binding protein
MKMIRAIPDRHLRMIPRRTCLLLLVVAVVFGPVLHASPQSSSFSQVNTLYVAPFTGGAQAAGLRESLVHRLEKSGKYRIVDAPQQADASMKGTGQIWVRGHFTINSRAPAANRETVYGGYLSVEVIGNDHEPLWSYLVTPSSFSWHSIQDDLAKNLVKQMLLAREDKGQPAAAPTGSKQVLAAADVAGAGATFPEPLYRKWFQSFAEHQPNVRLRYKAVGSEEGIHMLADGKVDFAASDVPTLTGVSDQKDTRRIASVLGAVVPIYNLSDISQDLNFTPEALADIYLGKITKWSDPAIGKSNRNADLPDAGIVVFHRSDGSGTTHAWSDFLSKVSPEWKDSVGTGTTLKWPVGTGVIGNEGVAEAVAKTPNSIGYVELVYAIQHQLGYGAVRNSSGNYIRADLNSVAEAASTAKPDSLTSITNPPGKDAYPIVSLTWLLFPQEMKDEVKKAALFELLRWILTSGQQECSSLGYAPLPRNLAAQQLDLLNSFH